MWWRPAIVLQISVEHFKHLPKSGHLCKPKMKEN